MTAVSKRVNAPVNEGAVPSPGLGATRSPMRVRRLMGDA